MKINRPLKRIIITGTHITPAIELINQLKNDSEYNWDINYIGRKFNSSVDNTPSIESVLIPKNGVKFYPIVCGKLDRRWLPNTIKGLPQTFKGLFSALKLVSQIKPDFIISFGGYVSVPVIIGAYLKHIPSITHEQTLTNSLTTKINSHFVNKVALSFDNQKQIDSLPKNKAVITGNLIRSEIFFPKESKFFKAFKNDKNIIYITAGNQGSHKLNAIIKEILPELKQFTLIHQTGKNDFLEYSKINKIYSNYHAFDYIGPEDIGWVFNRSKILISRAGANTCQEIAALKKSSILIPLLVSQQNEQELNALWVKKQLPSKTKVIFEKDLTPETLIKSIHQLETSIQSKEENHYKHEPNLKVLQLVHELI